MELMQITLGDYSNDGHGMTETINLMCSHTITQLYDLERKAEVAVGVTFSNYEPQVPICIEYEDYNINKEAKELIVAAGIDTVKESGGQLYSILDLEDNEEFAELFMRFLHSVDNTLTWKFVHLPTFASGMGYGRFLN